MAKADLPSGAWVEFREELKARDLFAVQEVAQIEFGEGKSKASFLALMNDQRNALLARVITGWSFDAAIPAKNDFAAADVVIGDAMDIDDYNALAAAVEPMMQKISGTNLPAPKKPSSD